MVKRIFIAVLLMMTVVMFCAAGGQSNRATSGKTHLVFWDENADPTRSPILQQMVANFNASQNRIEVEYVGVPQSDVQDKYNVAIAAGETPDIGGLQDNWLSGYVIRDAIIPLDEYFDRWSERTNMLPSAIDGVRQIVPDNKLYMLPSSMNTQTMWIRSDWLADARLPVPQKCLHRHGHRRIRHRICKFRYCIPRCRKHNGSHNLFIRGKNLCPCYSSDDWVSTNL